MEFSIRFDTISVYALYIHFMLFLAHLSHWLWVSDCDHWMSAVCRQQLLQKTSPPKLHDGF